MRCSLNLLVSIILLMATVLLAGVPAAAQTPGYGNIGRTPTAEEIRAWDTVIGINGEGLPPGRGTAKEGAPIYAQRCAGCHGALLEGRTAPRLAGGQGSLNTVHPVRTIGSYWPFATTIWDYIIRAMPPAQEGTLSADQVYALTAFLLYRNGIVQESDGVDAKSLPNIQMPNRNGFVPQRLEDIPDVRKRGCRLGICP
jgi:S-disulfanyl-L-cysteine oxidoreductase SoxD